MQSQITSWQSLPYRRKPRVVISCLPCHGRKIKCNRGRPCDRCTSAGRAEKCTYQATEGSQPAGTDAAARPEFPVIAAFAEGKARAGTSTSWARLLWDFEEAREYFFGIDPDYLPMYKRVKTLKGLFNPKQTTNFPFGDPATDLQSSQSLLSRLPAREIVDALLHNYVRTYERLLPLWHPPSFVQEMAAFWESPRDAGRTTLSQIFMMLALSCHSAPQGVPAFRRLNLVDMADSFFSLADAAFKGSQFMMVHDLAVLRTLCMAAVAKMMDLITFNDSRSCALLMGVVVRTAQTMSLHRRPGLFDYMPAFEGANRVRIWTTIMFLDLMTAVSTSLPPLIRAGDHDVFLFSEHPPSRESSQDSGGGSHSASEDSGYTEYQMLLSEALSLACVVVTKANSIKPDISHDEVEATDRKLRQILNKFTKADLGDGVDGVDAFSVQGVMLQRSLLQIFVRRMLLILHEPFARDPELSVGYKTSRFAVMECSLAVVLCHGSLSEAATLGNPVQWFLNLFKEDFGIAVIYVTRAIRRNDFETDAHLLPRTSPPREIAWTALRRSAEILEAYSGDSVNHFRIYTIAMYLIAALEVLEAGGSMLDKMLDTGRAIIAKVYEKKGREVDDLALDLAVSASLGTTTSGGGHDSANSKQSWMTFPPEWSEAEGQPSSQQSIFF